MHIGVVGSEKMVNWVEIRCVVGLNFPRPPWAALSPSPPEVGGVPACTPTPKLGTGSRGSAAKNKVRSVIPDLMLSMGIYSG